MSGSLSMQLHSTIPRTASGNSILTVSLFANGASTPSQIIDVNANGDFSFVGVTEGTYDLIAEAFGFLTVRLEDLVVGGVPVDVGTASLPIGDINADGAVSILDISGTASNFGVVGTENSLLETGAVSAVEFPREVPRAPLD